MGSTTSCGLAASSPLSFHDDLELIGGGEELPGADGKAADGAAGPVVQAIDLLDAPAVHQPVGAHLAAAAATLLGRLEDDHDGAVEGARLAQVFRGAQQHGGMSVMAAGMHGALHLRGMRQAGRLLDGQRVHVRTQADDPARGRRTPPDDTHHAGAADAGGNLIATEGAQAFGHQGSGSVGVEQDLRMFVQIAAPGADLGQHLGKAVAGGHGSLLAGRTVPERREGSKGMGGPDHRDATQGVVRCGIAASVPLNVPGPTAARNRNDREVLHDRRGGTRP
ncbi:hypothetical protein ruthe_01180 [Rubellimicrobium thermophilum DSM 16684]|uniref:Uncharacterized protein n=1 Tax=Rubellimicrobium thermophilum DSM 16684 TaxID=1123069 RepID=S9S862_9RHOB|nr:hypothetical protein ruthe_01180 [Rubellimicrobium thermophilum DSM 16684]